MTTAVALTDAPAQRPAPRIPAPPTPDTSSRHVLLVPLRWVTESIVSGTRVQYTLSCGHVAQRHYTKNFAHQVAYCPQCATHGIPVPYPLAEEPGTSLRAAGWLADGTSDGGTWDRPTRPRTDSAPLTPKQRWSAWR